METLVEQPTPNPTASLDRLLTIPEAISEMRISRTHFFRLKRQGVFRTVQLGHRTLVPQREISRLITEALAKSA
ncbi:hypothetical protein ACT17_05880 [Mycolicibacterium conceptionense]|uniref:Helix-turn-helix domain-containing protein n=1 Tax=Mycolicibacterium conceptionense TaxID=451644 RepID=A0A0J8X290_9MYCO|nr:hypothetical protein ACT17_05880 [Mycolicibacterium conceptionense]